MCSLPLHCLRRFSYSERPVAEPLSSSATRSPVFVYLRVSTVRFSVCEYLGLFLMYGADASCSGGGFGGAGHTVLLWAVSGRGGEEDGTAGAEDVNSGAAPPQLHRPRRRPPLGGLRCSQG